MHSCGCEGHKYAENEFFDDIEYTNSKYNTSLCVDIVLQAVKYIDNAHFEILQCFASTPKCI